MKKRCYCELSEDYDAALDSADVSAPEVHVHNIVSTTQIMTDGAAVDIEALSTLLPFTFYDKTRFAAITIRIGDPTCTALLFTSGKLVVTGAVSWYECVLAAHEITRILRNSIPHQAFWFSNCEIQNIVAKTCVVTAPGERLDIDLMYTELNNLCTFQKTMFPGLIYRPLRSPVVLLCFQSGKVVITGGRTVRDVELGWRMLWPQVRKFIVSSATV